MTLTTKIGTGLLILVLVTAGLSWSQLALISRLHDESRDLSQISIETVRLSLHLKDQVPRLRELKQKFLVLGDSAYGAEFARVRARIESDLARLETFDLAPAERHEVGLLAVLWQDYRALDEDDVQKSELDQHRARLDEAFDALRGQLDLLTAASRRAMVTRVEASGERVARARQTAWIATAAGLLAAFAISLVIVRSLVRPIRRLGRGTRALADGDFGYRVPTEGGPELSALAEDFNDMAYQLSQLDRLKKDFLANVSHDLKTPLASMQEATRLLLEGIPGPLEERQRRLLNLNLQRGDRLFRMIEDLLHLSQLAAGTVEYSPRRQDLVDSARAALDEIATLAESQQLEIATDFPSEPVKVAFDGPAIHKVLQNLLSNAVKYTPKGGNAGLRIRALDDRAELPATVRERWPGEAYLPAATIQVWDTGPGIPNDHKRRIFERFFRLDVDSGTPGTGLGLAIAREIVLAHGGDLWVEDRPGGGSVFRAVLWSRPPTVSNFEETALEPTEGRSPGSSWAALVLILALGLTPLAGCTSPAPIVIQPSLLEVADAAFDRGDYTSASAAYQNHLDHGSTVAADRVLFRLALMYVLPESEVRDPRRAHKLLAELIERFPTSPYRGAADYLLGLEREVSTLRRQLEEIKRIDLGES